MRNRPILEVEVQERADPLTLFRCIRDQRLGNVVDGAVERQCLDIDLGAVARRDDHRLPHMFARSQCAQQRLSARGVEADPLEQVDRRGVVGETQNEETHGAASAQELSSAVRRCLW